jgi:hypothetical protein
MSMNSESQRRWSKFGGFDARTASKWSTWHPTGLTPSTSAPGLGSPLPHLHWDWAHPCHICPGTGRTFAYRADPSQQTTSRE